MKRNSKYSRERQREGGWCEPLPTEYRTHLGAAGEISLAGEIRPVQHLKQRIKTASELGFGKIVAPEKEGSVKVVQNVKDLVKILFG
jgi:predicted ATP-dependent serine protease